jgi:hypothetical protein
MRILYDNAADRATVTASTTAGTLVAANLKTDIKSSVWRSTAIPAAITLIWDDAEVCNAAILPFCNLTATATLRARGYTNAADPSPAIDTGALPGCAYAPFGMWDWGVDALGVNAYSYGNGTYALTWDGSTLGIVGDVSGTSNISITGNARFRGAYAGSQATAAVYANETDAADTGVFGRANSTNAAIRGYQAHTSDGAGVVGVAVGGIGVSGVTGSASKAGVRGNNTGGGPSIECVTTFKWGGYTWSAPSGSGTVALLANGTWGNPNAAYAATAGETRNDASGASLWCGANQAIMQADGNFVVYNSGVPVGSSSGGFPSDERLKWCVEPTAVDALELLGRLNVVNFRWLPGTPQHAQRGNQIETGLIAQAVREQIPTLVTAYGSGESETLLLNKTEIVPLLIKAVQELSGQIHSLRQKIRAD